jgi:uncharacterized protein YigA (DUF484 family)
LSSRWSVGAWVAVALALAAVAALRHSNARLERRLAELEREAVLMDGLSAKAQARSLGMLPGVALDAAQEVGP